MQLTTGVNTITLETTGTQGPNLDHLEVQAGTATGAQARAYGNAFITADNGYILYVNGEQVGMGGAALAAGATYDTSTGAKSGSSTYDADGWKHTDRFGFYVPCETATSFAIEGVDSEGTAGILAQIDHCGSTFYSSTQWKCSPVTPMAMGAARTFKVVEEPMTWDQANQYCTQRFAGLASIHSAEEQDLAKKECASLVTTDEIPIKGCTASSYYDQDTDSKTYDCTHAYDNNGVAGVGEWATASEFGGWIQLNFEDSIEIGSMAFQQRWAEMDWATEGTLQFSDGSTQQITFQQIPDIVTYPIAPPKTTSFVKVTFTQVKYPQGAAPPAGFDSNFGNVGAKEIQFFEAGASPHGCWIGLNAKNGHRQVSAHGQVAMPSNALTWSDGSVANYQNWAPGEPNGDTGEDVTEMDFRLIGRCTGSPYAANQNNGCETAEIRNGEWNDNQVGGDGGSQPEFPLCQTATFTDPIESTYVGCYIDNESRDMQGIQAVVGGDMQYFDMGDSGSPDKCAQLCAGYVYFGLQYSNQCVSPLISPTPL